MKAMGLFSLTFRSYKRTKINIKFIQASEKQFQVISQDFTTIAFFLPQILIKNIMICPNVRQIKKARYCQLPKGTG